MCPHIFVVRESHLLPPKIFSCADPFGLFPASKCRESVTFSRALLLPHARVQIPKRNVANSEWSVTERAPFRFDAFLFAQQPAPAIFAAKPTVQWQWMFLGLISLRKKLVHFPRSSYPSTVLLFLPREDVGLVVDLSTAWIPSRTERRGRTRNCANSWSGEVIGKSRPLDSYLQEISSVQVYVHTEWVFERKMRRLLEDGPCWDWRFFHFLVLSFSILSPRKSPSRVQALSSAHVHVLLARWHIFML